MKKSSARISTLVAVSGGLAAMPAAAIELGEAQVNSSLGQPLRASISYALAPNETLLSSCVSVQSGAPQDALPAIGPATITVANGLISIAGKSAIREPLVTMRLNVRCAYTANLSRDYMLFIDPAETVAPTAATQTVAAQSIAAQPTVTPVATQTAAAPAPVATRRRPVSIEAVNPGSRHRVQPGETLGDIAQNIVDRPVGLWAAAGAIFDANPDAFMDDDPNKLKAGSWLVIPDFGSAAVTAAADNQVFNSDAEASTNDVAATAYPATTVEQTAVDPVEEIVAPAEVAEAAEAAEVVTDNPYVAPIEPASETIVSIPDTQLDGPEITATSPNVPVATVQPTVVEESATNWFLWLAGAGIALIGALLFFGRLLRERFGSSPVGVIAAPQRRRSDSNTQKIEAVSEIEVEFAELADTRESLALDADLIVGTGLQESSDIDVAQDFGFAAGAELDMELPEEMSSGAEASGQTDIIPPLNVDVESILESEVLPDDEDEEEDDYDMSVIVDATKMPNPDDVTQRDLEAVPVDTSDETLITGDYTVSHEVDYKVLEQDYEDEFTATQALNNEISRAAAELAARMDEEFGDEEDTKEMSLASVTALDITAQLPANNDDISDLDDTGINEQTVNMQEDADSTVNMQDADGTVEMPADDNTIEMPAKKGKSA